MRTLVEQLRDAYERTELTMDELLERTGLDLDRSSLRRKLLDVPDPIPMRTEEAEAIAAALDVTIAWASDEAHAS